MFQENQGEIVWGKLSEKGGGVQIKAHLIHIYLKQYSRMVVVLLVEEFLWEK